MRRQLPGWTRINGGGRKNGRRIGVTEGQTEGACMRRVNEVGGLCYSWNEMVRMNGDNWMERT